MVPRPKKHLHTTLRKRTQAEVFPPEVEHLLDVLAQIEARRQVRLRVLELERNSTYVTPEKTS